MPTPLACRLEIVAEASALPRARLLRWIVAQQALSAAWHLEDEEEDEAALPLAVLSAALALGAEDASD